MLQASQLGKDTKKRNVYLNREIFFSILRSFFLIPVLCEKPPLVFFIAQ